MFAPSVPIGTPRACPKFYPPIIPDGMTKTENSR